MTKPEELAILELEEREQTMWVASYALAVCEAFIEKGRPDAADFMSLCAALETLTEKVIGACEFHERAEELNRDAAVLRNRGRE